MKAALPSIKNDHIHDVIPEIERDIQSLKTYMKSQNIHVREGSATPAELAYFSCLIKENKPMNICEIGFNGGYSSHTFLQYSNANVVSFDIGLHDCVKVAKTHIDKKFPHRHTLVIGDSKATVPNFYNNQTKTEFDLIFIDGGHDYECSKADLLNMRQLAKKGGLVIMDDLTPWHEWGEGPTKAWNEAVQAGHISQLSLVAQRESHGSLDFPDTIDPPAIRLWGVGIYN